MGILDKIRGALGGKPAAQQGPEGAAQEALPAAQEALPAAQGAASAAQGAGLRKVGKEELERARQTLAKYKTGKATLEQRVISNEKWFRLRHWEELQRSANPGDPEPASAWLLNSLINKHADAMDNFPRPAVLPREESDRGEAEMLSSILPVVLAQNKFEQCYSNLWWRKLKTGTGVIGVFWSPDKLNGLGDIELKSIDLLSLFWEPGVGDIQQSRNMFHVALQDRDLLEERYPALKGKLDGKAIEVAKYAHDDQVDTEGKSVVVDWYYKRRVGTRTLLHYCKFCGSELLYASEDDPAYAERGFYDHGLYPFVFDTLFMEEDSPAGFGYLDICKSPQRYIDKLDQVILKNAIMAARPRYFIGGGARINEAEFADWERDFVHYEGSGRPEDGLSQIKIGALPGACLEVRNQKIDELKETSGNRDFSQGSTAAGVTAASAIAALQEAGSKGSRDMIKGAYRAFTELNLLAIELIRQFYDEPRRFRILGPQGAQRFVSFDNRGLKPQPLGDAFGTELGLRVAQFDITVSAQKASPFSTVAQNERAKELYGLGFFRPDLADQALAALEMMDFEGIERTRQRISENGTMYQQLQQLQAQMLQLAQIVDAQNGTTIAAGMAGLAGGDAARLAQPEATGEEDMSELATNAYGEAAKRQTDSAGVGRARLKAIQSTVPR